MKFIIFFLGLFICNLSLQAQIFKKIPPIVCPVDPQSYDTRVKLPDNIKKLIDAKRNGTQGKASLTTSANAAANIVVDYQGFTQEAEDAFQFAVDIWSALLSSPVTIHVEASFQDLGANVLGSAGASFLVRDFANAPSDTTFYPIALAEKIAGKDLNLPSEPDITSRFSSTFPWYFGTDGNTPPGIIDFVTVVLHELGHGLGFFGAQGYNAGTGVGNWDYFASKTGIYNQFVELGDGSRLLDLQTGTTDVGNALVGGDLFFNGPLAVVELGERPALYAPATYSGGSSFSHLDENTYPPGNAHSLMSPQVGAGESIHDPGVSLDIFADMGWFITLLDHEPIFVDNLTDNLLFEVTLRTDTTVTGNLEIIRSFDDFANTETIPLSDMGNNLYSASVANPGTNTSFKYYIQGITDGLGRTITSPSNVPTNYFVGTVQDQTQVVPPFQLVNNGDFEAGNAGFFSMPLVGDIDLWELGAPSNELVTSSTPTTVWKTDLDADIVDIGKAYSCALVSPYFDLSDQIANYVLSFEFAMDLGDTGGNLFETGPVSFNVEASIDGGTTWNVLGDVNDGAGQNWYNFHARPGDFFSPVFTNTDGWIIEDLDGITASFNVSSLAGNSNVAFRFVLHVRSDFLDDGYLSDGVLIDNFSIEKGTPTADFVLTNSSGVNFPGTQLEFEYISSGATSWLWDFGDGGSSTLENPTHTFADGGVYDVSLSINYSGGSDVVTKTGLVSIISNVGSSYTLSHGGDFETDNGHFLAENINGTPFERGNSSVTGKDGTTSGSFAWVTGLTDALYVHQSNAFLYTPLFDFSALGTYEISFNANYNTEQDWDGFIVEFTIDNGVTWEQVGPQAEAGWYDGIAQNNPDEGWPAIPLFSGNSNGYVTKSKDISDLGGNPNIGFRFHWLADFAQDGVGIAIDDFELTTPPTGPAVPEFSVSTSDICLNNSITFSNETTGAISSISWDFGTGADPATATGAGPHVVSYDTPGTSTVTLTVEGIENGTQIEQKTDFISIGAAHEPTITSERQSPGVHLLTASTGDTYQWFLDGDSIAGATAQTFLTDADGDYTVAVRINGCAGFSDASAPVEVITSIDDVRSNALKIYPNPVSGVDQINIEIADHLGGNLDVKFFNISGQLLSQFEETDLSATKHKWQYDVSNLSQGLYIISVDFGEGAIIRRFVIE